MKKIYNWILKSSAEKITKIFIILPIVILAALLILDVILQSNMISGNSPFFYKLNSVLIYGLFMVLIAVLFFVITWIRSIVYYSKEENIGISKKWFKYALYFFILLAFWYVYLGVIEVFNFKNRFKESFLFHSINSTIGSIVGLGILIGYPIICHYAARALYAIKTNEKATFTKTLGYSLLLMFIPFSIPFLHLYIYENRKDSGGLIKLFGFAIFLIFVLFVTLLIGVLFQ